MSLRDTTSRMARLHWRLEQEGRYTDANIIHLALQELQEKYRRPRLLRLWAGPVDYRAPRVLFLRHMRCKTARPDFDITLRVREYAPEPMMAEAGMLGDCLFEMCVSIAHTGFCSAPNGVHFFRPIPWAISIQARPNRARIRGWWSVVTAPFHLNPRERKPQ